jgi:hypothetical protein
MPRAMPRPIDRYGESAMAARACDHPGCASEGMHKAPRSREALTNYYWFCLDHVRAYNAAWNYYAGMNEREIEAELRNDTVWQRPTWRLSGRVSGRFGPYGLDLGEFDRGDEDRPQKPHRLKTPREQALAALDLSWPITLGALKARYKELVKRHHPDIHGGDKDAEERLKLINQAYSTLKAAFS